MKWHIASVSWGKDSLAMLLMLIAKGYPLNEVVFYDTGMEFEAIYHTRDQMLPCLEQLGIKYTRLEPENPFLFDMLERPVCSKQKGTHQGYGWCGGLCRWGTTGTETAPKGEPAGLPGNRPRGHGRRYGHLRVLPEFWL